MYKPFRVSDLQAATGSTQGKMKKPCGRAAKCVCNYRPSCQNAVINKQTCLEKLQSPVSAIFCHFRAFCLFFAYMKVNERTYRF